jgi:tetratricopeptide (TPR) repeat protein
MKCYIDCFFCGLLLCVVLGQDAFSAKANQDVKLADNGELNASRLISRAEELLGVGEYESGVRMLENVIEQNSESPLKYRAMLIIGRHYVNTQKYPDAVKILKQVLALGRGEKFPEGEELEWYLEGQYLTGVAYFNMRQYDSCFNTMRILTKNFPNTVWANQAYYYIGMCHFAQQRWNKAIESLSMVGVGIDSNSAAVDLIEAGKRLYVKAEDNDLAVIASEDKGIEVEISTSGGDREKILLYPAMADKNKSSVIGSIPTAAGAPQQGNGVLEVKGGDEIIVRYIDLNDNSGTKVTREQKVKVVSSGELDFTLGSFEEKAQSAYRGQDVFIRLKDLDLDITDGEDIAKVRVISRYRPDVDEEMESVGAERFYISDNDKGGIIRDDATITLKESGTNVPVHSGVFVARIKTVPYSPGTTINKADDVLVCDVGDELVAIYADEKHISGNQKRDVFAVITVSGDIESHPVVMQNIVTDPVVKARKSMVEAKAYLELAKIFKDMGLLRQAFEKSDAGLERVDSIIKEGKAVPPKMQEEAFKLKWELYLAVENYESAIQTCTLFSRLFPNSVYMDEALLKTATGLMQIGEYNRADGVFGGILNLPNSSAKAEAQFRIAEIAEKQKRSDAIQLYKLCAERYPNSEFAGKALEKVVDYLFEKKDYKQADEMLKQVFEDYPDANFLDSLLFKWVVVAYRTGDSAKAYEKATQLLSEYPGSKYAEEVKKILPKLEGKAKESE